MRKIIWYPGMVLTDEHLTLQEQNHGEYLQDLTRALNPYNWGVISLELDLLTIGQGYLLVKEVLILTAEGNLLSGKNLKANLSEGFIYIKEVNLINKIGEIEYSETRLTLDQQGIFPLFKINKNMELANDYLPPCINLKTFSWFRKSAENLLQSLKNRIDFLVEKGDFILLKQIIPRIFSNFSLPHLHPLDFYKDMAWLWGILELEKDYPIYDHQNLGPLFTSIMEDLVTKLITAGAHYEKITFSNVAGGFKIPVINQGNYIIGLKKEAKPWFEQAIIGGEKQFDSLCNQRVLGAKRTPCEFSDRSDLVFWELDFDKWSLGDSQNFLIQNPHLPNPQELIVYLKEIEK